MQSEPVFVQMLQKSLFEGGGRRIYITQKKKVFIDFVDFLYYMERRQSLYLLPNNARSDENVPRAYRERNYTLMPLKKKIVETNGLKRLFR